MNCEEVGERTLEYRVAGPSTKDRKKNPDSSGTGVHAHCIPTSRNEASNPTGAKRLQHFVCTRFGSVV